MATDCSRGVATSRISNAILPAILLEEWKAPLHGMRHRHLPPKLKMKVLDQKAPAETGGRRARWLRILIPNHEADYTRIVRERFLLDSEQGGGGDSAHEKPGRWWVGYRRRPGAVWGRRRVSQTAPWVAATFWWAFFCRRGKRDQFFFCSFGCFIDFVWDGAGAGSATPASDAILPAAVPTAFAVAAKTLSWVSGSMGFLRPFGFCSSAIISSSWREHACSHSNPI